MNHEQTKVQTLQILMVSTQSEAATTLSKLFSELADITEETRQAMKGIITGIRRTPDGQLVAQVNLEAGGLIIDLPNTASNFQMDEEVVAVFVRRSEADELWNDIGRVAEIVEKDFSVEDARRLWALAEAFKPDESVPFMVNEAAAGEAVGV